ncbi:MAG TPA: nucleotidyltransferase domain-containing protein [Polyangia bacterium]|jgi:predicted nucleotidyltransferase
MVPAPVMAALAEFKRRLVARFGDRVERVTLFGSYARGEQHEESDVDVLVVIRDVTGLEQSAVARLGGELLTERGVDVMPVVFSPEAWADLEGRELLVAEDVAREGVAV